MPCAGVGRGEPMGDGELRCRAPQAAMDRQGQCLVQRVTHLEGPEPDFAAQAGVRQTSGNGRRSESPLGD